MPTHILRLLYPSFIAIITQTSCRQFSGAASFFGTPLLWLEPNATTWIHQPAADLIPAVPPLASDGGRTDRGVKEPVVRSSGPLFQRSSSLLLRFSNSSQQQQSVNQCQESSQRKIKIGPGQGPDMMCMMEAAVVVPTATSLFGCTRFPHQTLKSKMIGSIDKRHTLQFVHPGSSISEVSSYERVLPSYSSDCHDFSVTENDGVCVQTLGGDNWFCTAESFSDYNPYDNGGQSWSASTESSGESDLSISKFPYQLLSHKGSSQVLSLAPDMTREEFATYGPWNVSTDVRLGGRYNSGEDIQSLAGVGWYPFLSSVRIKDDPLNNYSGYYIANSLQQSPPMKMPYSEEAKERRSLMEKLDIVSMFFGGADMIQRNEKFLREYTNEVYPFGCRSTLPSQRLPLLNPALVNFTSAIKKAKEEKDLVLLVDVVDRSALPPLPSNARWLSADIPEGYPRSCQPQSERIDYCYRLLSQYANHAKVVITSRIHVGLPAAAMGTPVIFVSKGGWLPGGKEKTGRVADKKLTLGFDLSGPIPPNPGNHEADRRRAAFWHRLKRVSYYEDAARIFGQIPFQRLGAGMVQDDFHNNFHVVMNQTDLSDWRSRRTIEAVLFFHPNAKILIHVEGYVSSGGSQGLFAIFAESGYDVRLVPISSQRASVKQIKMLLQKFGGVFLSKGTFIRGALPVALDEGYSLDEHGDVALMIGKKAAVKATNKTWVASYLSSTQTQQCMSDPTWEMESTEDIAITVDRASLLEHDIIMDTRCYDLIEKNCIYNDDLHWKYGKETGVLLKLSDGSTARYCEGQIGARMLAVRRELST
ncbi:hypothetical protein QTG54_002433 [Skeletonema marinoi]|uniref:Polysaccharide pyruvyl transferase domain-containing protein n=1 Tax=Skeletonema marinoi TaxID=267567 RepID=A0AAD9DI90_9STRA|nr:hypothetical protein QTG54_002433 [Skeletonema marinoi]